MVVASTAIVGSAPAQAAPPSAPYDAMVLTTPEYGNWIISENVSFDPSNATFTSGADANDRFSLSGNNGDVSYGMSFEPPTGQTFTVGTTYQSRRFNDATYAALSMGTVGRGCNQEFGSFTVKEVARDAEDRINVFAASFAHGCETDTLLVTGEVRWKSTVPYTGKVADVEALDFGTQDIGFLSQPRTVTITSTGSDPTVFGTATLQGAVPGAYVISADTCSGSTRSYGQTCSVSIKAKPTSTGGQEARLLIADNTVGGGKLVRLNVSGMVGARGLYYPLSPQRLLDTRTGNGAPAPGAIGPGGTINLQVNGRGGVPSTGVAAAVLNVTVTSPTASGHVTVYPSGTTRPTASSLNFVPGWTGANSVTVPVGTNGQIALYNSNGNSHLIVDVVGFYAANNDVIWCCSGLGGQLFTHTPTRVLDTRFDFGQKLPGGYYVTIPMDYDDETNPHVRAVIVNITAVDPNGNGYLSGWNGKLPVPATSTLNYGPGGIVPNLAIVPTAPCGSDCNPGFENLPMIGVYTNQDTHVIVDVVGFLDDSNLDGGLRFEPNSPTRIVDSRFGQGLPGKIGQGATANVTTPGALAGPDTRVLALNVTAVAPTETTHMIVWQAGAAMPATSNLNPSRGQVIPNAVVTRINPSKQFSVYNNAGLVDVVIDVVGTFFVWGGASAFSAQFRGGAPAVPVPANLAPQSIGPSWHRG